MRAWSVLLLGVLCTAVAEERPGEEEKPAEEHTAEAQPMQQKEAEHEDTVLVAKTFRWAYAAAEQHMHAQRQFARLTALLQKTQSDRFAGSEMAREPGAHATLWFKGSLAGEGKALAAMVAEHLEGTSLDGRVRFVDSMRYSFMELEERADAVAEALDKRGFPGVGHAVLPGDLVVLSVPEGNGFEVTEGGDGAPAPAQEKDEQAERLLDGTGVDAYGVKVVFYKKDAQLEKDHHTRGGRKVYGGGFQCTSGFTVSRLSDGVTGVATAAHCNGMSTYDAEAVADYALSHRGEHNGNYGDVEWKTTSHIEPAEYWASPTSLRDVTSINYSFSKNDVICVYSRMQGTRTCDYVYSTSVSQSGAKKLVAMDNDNTVGGDSGGPYSYGSEASGIVKGAKVIWFKWRGTFSKANLLDEALGVVVRCA